jgi:hypothetical protein
MVKTVPVPDVFMMLLPTAVPPAFSLTTLEKGSRPQHCRQSAAQHDICQVVAGGHPGRAQPVKPE